MKIICTRYIVGNRGDLLSRYGILSALTDLGFENRIHVMASKEEHIKPLNLKTLKYGKMYNTIFDFKGWKAFFKSDVVLWTGGLDLSDHSSTLKLFYILFNFIIYRILRHKIIVLNQGAGPIQTKLGRMLIKRILNLVDVFVVRDRDSLILLKSFSSKTRLILSYDGIFAGKLFVKHTDSVLINHIFTDDGNQLVIGFNIRKWFFFTSGLFPVYMNFGKKHTKENKAMEKYTDAAISAIRGIRSKLNCKVVLISAYESNSSLEFDDLPFLLELKSAFQNDNNVILMDNALELSEYLYVISKLDLVIGTRLHTTLAALRLNVPSINLNYTLKGKSILKDMGLLDLLIELDDFIENPSVLLDKILLILNDDQIINKIKQSVSRALQHNYEIFEEVFNTEN